MTAWKAPSRMPYRRLRSPPSASFSERSVIRFGGLSVFSVFAFAASGDWKRCLVAYRKGKAALVSEVFDFIQRLFKLPPSRGRECFVLLHHIADFFPEEIELGGKFIPLLLERAQQREDLVRGSRQGKIVDG